MPLIYVGKVLAQPYSMKMKRPSITPGGTVVVAGIIKTFQSVQMLNYTGRSSSLRLYNRAARVPEQICMIREIRCEPNM